MSTQNAPIPMYAVAMQEAIKSGALADLQKARDAAVQHLSDAADIARSKGEIAAYAHMISNPESGAVSVTPYGLAIQQAKDRGDQAEVERLTKVAEGLLAQLNAGKS
jgi:hypothetical protein